jgi:hypothetical protein
VSVLVSPPVLAGYLGFGLLLGVLVYRGTIPLPIGIVVAVSTLFLVPALLLFTGGCYSSPPAFTEGSQPSRFEFINQSTAPAAGGTAATESILSLPLLLGVSLVLTLVVAVAFVAYRADGNETLPSDSQESVPHDNETEVDASAVGTVAGKTADRIETGLDVDNEVYRAWVAMTAYLDVSNPTTSTPAEFATAATNAGMDSAHVDELTDLFRSVRYGGDDPTSDREERAITVLRAIESHDTNEGDD